MPRKKIFIRFIFPTLLLITSCTRIANNASSNIATPKITQLPTSTATKIPIPTLELTPTQNLLPPSKVQCADTSKETSKFDLTGVVALNKAAKLEGSEFGFYLLNLENGNIVRSFDDGMFVQVSPDRKNLVYKYLMGDTGFLRIVNSNGQTIKDFASRTDEFRADYFNWQNSEQLRILKEGNENKLSAFLLNPFTQQQAPLRTDWNDVYRPNNPFRDKLVQWKFDRHATAFAYVYGANILYDPSLTRVLYPKENGNIVLMNVKNETELASTQFEDWGKLPSWSPDGQYLLVVSHESNADEIYVISRNGNVFQKITNFSVEEKSVSISEAVWSPDNQHIAFWLKTEADQQQESAQSELATLDVITRQITKLCIQGVSKSATKPWLIGDPEPIWSPDGRFLMFTQWDNPAAPNKYDVLVLDTETGAVKKISENTAPIGWMINE